MNSPEHPQLPECFQDVAEHIHRLLTLGTKPSEIRQSYETAIGAFVGQVLQTQALEIERRCREAYTTGRRRHAAPPWAWTAEDPAADADAAAILSEVLARIESLEIRLGTLRETRNSLAGRPAPPALPPVVAKKKPHKPHSGPAKPRKSK